MYWKIVLVNIFGQSIGFGARSLLSTHFLSTHLQSKSVAISLQCYPNICYQTHLLSTQLWSHSFAIKPHLLSSLNCYRHIYFQASIAIKPHLLSSLICYAVLTSIDTFTFKPHLLTGQLAINPQLQLTILLSIIICQKIFNLILILIFNNFFPKHPPKK